MPSLLSRLALGGDSRPSAPQAPAPAKRAAESDAAPPAKRQHTTTPAPARAQPPAPASSVGFSIKGAAQRVSEPERERPASLLNRLTSEGAAAAGGAGGKKRRTKT